MATDSFTSSALGVSSATGTMGFVVAAAEYNQRGFYVKIDPTGVSVTKSSMLRCRFRLWPCRGFGKGRGPW